MHDLGGADPELLGVDAGGDAATVVLDRDRAVEVDGDVHARCSSRPRCSSTALSTASHTRWWRPEPSWTSPMYMPGRLRTASRPSRTVMLSLPYVDGGGTLGDAVALVIRCSGCVCRKGVRSEVRARLRKDATPAFAT